VAEEMGLTLQRTGYSPNIKERRDFSCAVFDPRGEMAALAAHIPVHLGSSQETVKFLIENIEMNEGDAILLNDPYHGGTHLPDLTLVNPVFIDGNLEFFVANRAHHSDIGGKSPGSMPLATSIEDEGLVIKPTKLIKAGKLDTALMDEVANATRTPTERLGDLNAQVGANAVGVKRLKDLVEKYGVEQLQFYTSALQDHSEAMVRHVIGEIPDGTYRAQDVMDDDGFDTKDIPLVLKLRVQGEEATLDFTGTSPQVKGGVNAVAAITNAAVFYVFRALAGFDIPTNSGIFRPLRLILPPRSLVNAEYPSPVAGGNVETSQRITDVVLKALAKALPDKVPAAGQGTMNNIAIGGKGFTYYETLGGGMGASAKGPGASAVHVHMTNTLNTPIEALEHSFPFKVLQYSVRKGSGGKGKNQGGDGIVREYEFLEDVEVTIMSERREHAPWGLEGGGDGKAGRNVVIEGGVERDLGPKANLKLKKGDRLRIETPGGGGWGKKP
jgi:N-methylhydantoinase B